MTRHLISDVAQHSLVTGRSRLTDNAYIAAERLILDSVGVGIAGATSTESRMALETARTWGQGEEAGVWAGGVRLPAGSAALVNAHQMHCLEFDSIHEPAVVHPMSVVLPVLSAFVQRAASSGVTYSGEQLLRAVVVGVDVAGGLGAATSTPLQFFRPGTAGAMGAVAALGALTQVSSEQLVGAFGVVYGALSGTMQPHREGAQVLALQVGFNARGALSAWDLAEAGFRGPRQILEGPFGYYSLIEAGGDPEAFVAGLGRPHGVEVTSIKPYPSGRATHGALSAVLGLQHEHGFTFDEVERVDVAVPPMVQMLVGRGASDGLTPGAARLCLPYLVAVALDQGTVSLSAFENQALSSRRYLDFASSVHVGTDTNPDPNAFDPQTVTIKLRDGASHTVTQERSLGSPGLPLPKADLIAKFDSNLVAGGMASRSEQLQQAVRDLRQSDDAAKLLELM